MQTDLIAALSGAAAAPVRAHRAELMEASLRNQLAVLEPRDPGGLSAPERRAIARRIALRLGNAALADEYEPEPAAEPEDARWSAILRHVDLVTDRPREATRADIDALRAAGIGEADIVRISQLIAFVNYQARVIAGLRLIGAAP
jgi:uncharacterized protein YciW